MADNMIRGTDLQGLSPAERAAAVEAAGEEVSRRARGERERTGGGTGIDPDASRRAGEAVADASTPDVQER